jgi:hypothetical protein
VKLEWWQLAIAIIGALGLSPAPWIAAILTRRLMPLGAHLERVADIKAAHILEVEHQDERHARELAGKDQTIDNLKADRVEERAATKIERDRADAAASKLAQLTEQFGQVTVGILSGGNDRGKQR